MLGEGAPACAQTNGGGGVPARIRTAADLEWGRDGLGRAARGRSIPWAPDLGAASVEAAAVHVGAAGSARRRVLWPMVEAVWRRGWEWRWIWIAKDWAVQICWVCLHLDFAFLYSVIRVFFTHCILVLDLCSSRISTDYLVTRALGSPSMVFVTPIWPEFSFGAIRVIFTLCVLVLCRIRFSIPRMVFVTPLWPEFSFGTPFLREIIFIFPIWYSDTLQEIMLCKRIITVAGGFGPQSLVGDPVLVVYSLGIFCNFNGFVCLFHGTSLFRDLYAVMDIVQFKD